jgi:uncharacterized protein
MMNREQFVLAALGAGNGSRYSPVQVQKLLFLIEKKAGKELGHHFNFKPYDYGPFDKDVYRALEILSQQGLVEIIGLPSEKGRQYKLSPRGQAEAKKLLDELPSRYKRFLVTLSDFVRSLTFSKLVSAIYREYPAMKVNSIFNG